MIESLLDSMDDVLCVKNIYQSKIDDSRKRIRFAGRDSLGTLLVCANEKIVWTLTSKDSWVFCVGRADRAKLVYDLITLDGQNVYTSGFGFFTRVTTPLQRLTML